MVFTASLTLNLAVRSSEVVDFGTNRKRAYDFLLVLNSSLGSILPRFRDIRAFTKLQSFTLQQTVLRGIMQCCRLVGTDEFSAWIGTVGE